MKRTLLLIVLAAALSAGCNRQTVAPRFGEVVIDTLLGGPTAGYRVQYRYTAIENAARNPSLAAIERRNVAYFFGTEADDEEFGQALDRSFGELATMLPPAGSAASCYELTVESEAAVVDTLLTYAISRSGYSGGAHGMYTIEYHTYSLDGGYEVTLADLFSERQRAAMRDALRHKLYASYGVTSDEGLSGLGFFPTQIALTENFTLTADSLIFQYNSYDIACYATGPVTVSFARSEIGAE